MANTMKVQALLRFLSQDARVPLPIAMGKIKDLQQAALTSYAVIHAVSFPSRDTDDFSSPDTLAKSDVQTVQAIFADEKRSKQIISAAKRVTKKRSSSETQLESPAKRKKAVPPGEQLSPAAIEESLVLPEITANEEALEAATIYTNRAPLVLAFAATLLKHTLPEQPLSSRLSLAKAVVSANSKTKAKSLGIEKGNTAEDEGWGQGQPKVRVMGREISVMKRWGYNPKEGSTQSDPGDVKEEENPGQVAASQSIIQGNEHIIQTRLNDQNQNQNVSPPLWGLDLDALRSSSNPLTSNPTTSTLPIHDPKSAKEYLLKSFASPTLPSPSKKKPARAIEAEKSRNLALLLQALDLLYNSWAHVLSSKELDRRAWAWYVAVRPEVQDGAAGWGGKGEVKLARILELRRKG